MPSHLALQQVLCAVALACVWTQLLTKLKPNTWINVTSLSGYVHRFNQAFWGTHLFFFISAQMIFVKVDETIRKSIMFRDVAL